MPWAAVLLACLTGPALAVDDAERLRRAVAHTVSVQLPNGLFQYDFDFLAGEPTGEDNIVRQAGTLFVLGDYRLQSGDASLDAVLRAGLERLAADSVPVGKSRMQRVLESLGLFALPSLRWGDWLRRAGFLYSPDGDGLLVTEEGSYAKAFPGSTALALTGELAYWRATGDERFAETREAWLRGLYAMHVPGRGIRYAPEWLQEDPYFNGETWLALARFHESFPEHALAREMLLELEGYLLERYTGKPDPLFYHWGALAGAVRYRTTRDVRLAGFLARQSEAFLDARPPEKTRLHTTCSLIEGVASSLWVLESAGSEVAVAARLRERLDLELARNRAMQIAPGQERLELGDGGWLVAPSLKRFAGAFLAGPYRPYWRIDVTQHCISAWIQLARLRTLDGTAAD